MKKSLLIILLSLLVLIFISGPVFAYSFGDVGSLTQKTAGQTGLTQTDPAAITANVIKLVLGLLGAIFVTLFIYGGITWMIAGGNDQKVQSAKKVLTSAIVGIVVIIASYSITFFITSALERASAPSEGTSTNPAGPTDCPSIGGACYTFDACTRDDGSVIDGICVGGDNDGVSCTTNNECPGGTCNNWGCGNEICCLASPQSTSQGDCSSCGSGILNVCGISECNSLGPSCIFYNNHCYLKGDCSACGYGASNICDAAECVTLGCTYDSSHSPKCY